MERPCVDIVANSQCHSQTCEWRHLQMILAPAIKTQLVFIFSAKRHPGIDVSHLQYALLKFLTHRAHEPNKMAALCY